ncbi:MFS transporter [Nocardiopsis sp. N85]|uniref:MFS transporter n=1 Tax=Nocardiopsis sp. N85 TaxID=3029400 RepID=UPI00237FB6CA|nr:MFS transporter [Nocardiopsis sp. N85]MDE3720605.1 MFS transporter [Nocardiopsis sp. N85]
MTSPESRTVAEARTAGPAALALLATAHFTLSLDFNVVYIALPEIGRAFDLDDAALPWVVNAFALGYGGLLLLGGRAVDRLGARRMLVLGALLLGLSSVAGALADHAGVLIAARAAQGVGAAALFPATLALIGTAFPAGPARNRAMAVWGSAGAGGALAGGAVGGVLASAFGWSAVFWAIVVPSLAVALAASRLLPADRHRPDPRGFDLPGTALVTVGALLLVFGVFRLQTSGWLSLDGGGVLLLGLAALAALVPVERRSADPLLPATLLRDRHLPVAMVLILVLMGVVATLHYVYTTHVQTVLGLDPLAAGLGFLPQGAAAMLGSALLLPRLLARGVRTALFVGTVGVGLTSAAFAVALAFDSYWAMLPVVILLGLTAGTVYPVVFTAAGGGVGEREQGVASAAASTAQQIGGALGLTVLAAVAGVWGGLGTAALVGGAATVVVAFAALLLPRPDRS